MSLVGALFGFGMRQVLGDGVENIGAALEQRFRDHSQTLPKALQRAHERAWQSLGVALAGDGFLDRVRVLFASGDDKGVREQVRLFLDSNAGSFPGTTAEFRQVCVDELRRLQKSGLLSGQALPVSEIGSQAAAFRRHADPQGLLEGARQAVGQAADALRETCPNLSRLLTMPTPAGAPLLAAAFAYFFRREVETDDELANGLFFDGLRQLSAAQSKAFSEMSRALSTLGDRFDAVFEQLGRIEAIAAQTQTTVAATHEAVLDLQAEQQRLNQLYLANAEEVRAILSQVQLHLCDAGMQRGEVRPQHSCSIGSEDERRAVKALLNRLRQLSPEERQKLPALLNGLGKLQVGAGDFEGAQQTFSEVASSIGDAGTKAEVWFNAYRAALEARRWEDALHAIREAAILEPQRFAPFPLHRYEPKRILGAGGFGTAFLCHDANLDEDVVIKTLHAGDLDRGLSDVFREARILRQLSHSAIIGARDCEYADAARRDRPYLVMDYFPGGTLEQLIEQNGPLAPEELPLIAVPIARAMQAAHCQNILHRDLKPGNVLVRKEDVAWQVKIIDFGLAMRQQTIETSVAARHAGSTVLGGSVAGTLRYAPPEQMGLLRGIKPGPYSDVYAFGKLCCYALFETTEPTRRQWATIPDQFADILDRCVEQDLKHRYPGFEPVLQGFEALASGAGANLKGRKNRGEKPPPTASKQPGSRPQGDIEAYYREFRNRHGVRPRASQAFRDGYDPRTVRVRHGGWLQFVEAMGDLSEGQKKLLRDVGDFLGALETTAMTKSFKMLTLQAMLNRKSLPGTIATEELAREFGRLAAGSAVLLAEVAADVNDLDKLCRYLEKNPIAAWAGGKGAGAKPWFAYEQGRFSSSFVVDEDLLPEFHELAKELIEWRLTAYLQREEKR